MRFLSGFVGLLVFLSGCNQSAPVVDSSLGELHSERWEALLNAADLDALVNFYTDDVRIMPPNGKMKMGRAAVREEFGAMISAGMEMDLQSLESQAVGDTGFNTGTYVLKIGGETIDTGKWMETWRREADGVWRISNDIWNSDNPPPPAEKKAMTHMIGTHKVKDAGKWLAAWRGPDGRRKDFAAHGAPHVHVMQSVDDPNLTGLVIGLENPAMFDAWLKSDAGNAAAEADTVDMSTLTILMEVQ